jgi:hypothetical protein
VDDEDRLEFLGILVETPEAGLSRGMRRLNGVYHQAFNRRHRRPGHLFQGRYKSILVERDAYLLEVARYIVLNPVRAGSVEHPGRWEWSSYRATAGLEEPPPFLGADRLLPRFDPRPGRARRAYRRFVSRGKGVEIWRELRGGAILEEPFAGVRDKADRDARIYLAI